MNSNNDTIKLTKKEYYKIYQKQNRDKIRENCRRYYNNKVIDDDYRLELNKRTLTNKHNRLLKHGIIIRPTRGRPRKIE